MAVVVVLVSDGADSRWSRSVVYFTASWCGPCRQIKPIFEEMSNLDKYKHVKFVKADVDHVPDVANVMQIRSVPTFCFYKDGKLVQHFSGANAPLLKSVLHEVFCDLSQDGAQKKT
jgi:thioredoxin 1